MTFFENRGKSFDVGSQTSAQAWEIPDISDGDEYGDFPVSSLKPLCRHKMLD